ncbi:MAG TPA: hypothetical protein VNL95_03150 [Dehalococcoidia bacterium]|nr:hypothetical protein [Dehalococcoidia bacterium]
MAGRKTIADIARRYRLPYQLLWKSVTGGYLRPPPLPPDLEERLRAALEELEREGVAGDAS